MKLSVKATAAAAATIWGVLAMFLTGVVRLAWPDYGQAFMDVMASLYPGFDGAATFKNALVGGLYGAVDGAVCGVLFAWCFNAFGGKLTASSP